MEIYVYLSFLFIGAAFGSLLNYTKQGYENFLLFNFVGAFLNVININFIKHGITSGSLFYLAHGLVLLFMGGIVYKNRDFFKQHKKAVRLYQEAKD